MAGLIDRFGLFAIFVGAVFEGDVTLILTGVAAHLGFVRFATAVAVGGLAACVADSTCYAVARARRTTIGQNSAYRRVAPLVDSIVGRVGAWEIVITRFIYGTRLASMIYWGMQALPFGRFLMLDLIGCGLWAVALAAVGYACSGSAAVLVGEVKRAERWLLVGCVAAAAAVFAARYISRRRLRNRTAP